MKKILNYFIPLFVFSMCLTSCGDNASSSSIESFDSDSEAVVIEDIPNESFHTIAQAEYLADTYESVSKYASGTKEMSIPYGNVFALESTNAKYMCVSDDIDFSEYRLFDIEGIKAPRIRNLLSDTTYFYKTYTSLEFIDANLVESGSLKTDNVLPRNVYIPSLDKSHFVTNVRDLGGYASSLGGKVRQGLVYRGGRLSGGETTKYTYDENGEVATTKVYKPALCFSDDGYNQLTKVLKITNEVDLRRATKDQTFEAITTTSGTKSVVTSEHIENGNRSAYPDLIKGMNVHTISINASETDFLRGADGKNSGVEYIKEFFNICAEPTNYPMYVHCYIGTDRTGALCYLLGALCGIDRIALVRDYLFSNFGNIGGSRDPYAILNIYEPVLNSFNKPTLAENAESYLLSIGVPQAQIDAVRNIMIEK